MTTPFSANWIQRLPPSLRHVIHERMSRKTFNDGDYIYRRGEVGDNQYQIISGSVRLRAVSERGKEATYVIYGPEDCFGFLSVLDRGPRPHDAIAVGTVELHRLDYADFEALRTLYPLIDRVLCEHLCQRTREMISLYESGAFFRLRRRLAHQILFLQSFAGRPSKEGYIELDLTQEMLASSVCATRQAVNKLLKEWSDDGVLDYHYGHIRIIDPHQLHMLAQQDEPE
ncbi:Crp/Fnr family transcriptional regulator [Aestuariirhabdus litorea]|uniref:Crp/Fnr family transcriptional regulator n=1 Tax=Aestuariirhabdus litorea TaxID=2528527 RepID=A0A3P3VLB3_9GAMM|nr:Crp/Fnr family transcriptional regulator [Aestuariirhabdus litorea]RRJ82668.1 Crp/Fnr family transcriptional regulator [Aestuariirhabdus litorea]RWW92828.1 cyclic nucleotide-binding domain-containing protein [Endozoicomonadaceae bacterium GTF-13]